MTTLLDAGRKHHLASREPAGPGRLQMAGVRHSYWRSGGRASFHRGSFRTPGWKAWWTSPAREGTSLVLLVLLVLAVLLSDGVASEPGGFYLPLPVAFRPHVGLAVGPLTEYRVHDRPRETAVILRTTRLGMKLQAGIDFLVGRHFVIMSASDRVCMSIDGCVRFSGPGDGSIARPRGGIRVSS